MLFRLLSIALGGILIVSMAYSLMTGEGAGIVSAPRAPLGSPLLFLGCGIFWLRRLFGFTEGESTAGRKMERRDSRIFG